MMQALLQQDIELGQEDPQAPQLDLLMRVSTQVPLQQVWVMEQALPQTPQLFWFAWRLVQLPLQHC